MNDNEQFLKIIDKFIDSVGAINQNIGPVKDTLIHIVDRIDKQNLLHEDFKRDLITIKESIISSSEQMEKINETIDILKQMISKNSDLEIKKLELDTQIKVAEITQTSTTVREISAKKWAFWGIVIPALAASIIGLITVMIKPEKKDESKIIERVIEKR